MIGREQKVELTLVGWRVLSHSSDVPFLTRLFLRKLITAFALFKLQRPTGIQMKVKGTKRQNECNLTSYGIVSHRAKTSFAVDTVYGPRAELGALVPRILAPHKRRKAKAGRLSKKKKKNDLWRGWTKRCGVLVDIKLDENQVTTK